MSTKPLNPSSQDKLLKRIEEICRFVPADGFCYRCNKNIFNEIIIQEDMPTITSCPYCHASFVE